MYNFLFHFNNQFNDIVITLKGNASLMRHLASSQRLWGNVRGYGINTLMDTPVNILNNVLVEAEKRLTGLDGIFNSNVQNSFFRCAEGCETADAVLSVNRETCEWSLVQKDRVGEENYTVKPEQETTEKVQAGSFKA